MKSFRYVVALSLLLPIHRPARSEHENLALAIGVGTLGAIVYGLSLLFKKNPDKKSLLDQTHELCSQINYWYGEELEIIRQYQPALYHNCQCKYELNRQENLRKDLVERMMSRGTGEHVDHPLHYQEETINLVVIKNIDDKIKAITIKISTIDAKLKNAQGQHKQKLIMRRQQYVVAKERCERLKKDMETIRGAVMMSFKYGYEKPSSTGTPRVATQLFTTTNQPHPAQQQQQK